MKNKLTLLFIPFVLFTTVSCAKTDKKLEVKDILVKHETEFDSIYITLTIDEFKGKGFKFGDSVNVSFSNGDVFEDVPFYDGYYTQTGEVGLIGYQGYPYITLATNNVGHFWQNSGLTEEDTASIVLNEKEKYIINQETFSMHYEDDRNKYSTDQEFGNYRPLSGGAIDEDAIYRGASPIDNVHKRASYCDDYLEENDINFVLNLSNTTTTFEANLIKEDFDSPYVKGLYEAGKVACVGLSMDYKGRDFKVKLCNGLKEMVKYPAPYYVHCTEGKDRTGFVCLLLEALVSGNYETMKNDYMKTYENYYGVTEDKEKQKYDAIVSLRFDDFCSYLYNSDNLTVLKKANYSEAASDYLMDGGMTREEILQLIWNISHNLTD